MSINVGVKENKEFMLVYLFTGELVIEVKSFYEFQAVKKEMLDILDDYEVSQTEAKFNYTVYSRYRNDFRYPSYVMS